MLDHLMSRALNSWAAGPPLAICRQAPSTRQKREKEKLVSQQDAR